MPSSLKTILDAVLLESGFQVPASYTAGLNPDDLQMVALANAAGDEIREMGLEQAIREVTIPLTTATSYALPSDFLSYVPDTGYVVGRLDPIMLPTTPAEWAVIKSGNELPGDTIRARFIGGQLEVINPTNGDAIRLEYVSDSPWTAGDAVTPKESATLDTDLWWLDRRLLVLATKWRWKKEKGLTDWQADYQAFQQHANAVRARNGGARTLCLGDPGFGVQEPYTPLWVS